MNLMETGGEMVGNGMVRTMPAQEGKRSIRRISTASSSCTIDLTTELVSKESIAPRTDSGIELGTIVLNHNCRRLFSPPYA